MAKYIENKEIDPMRSNDIKDLQDIDKAAWKFVITFYMAGWNFLIADIYNNTFRQKMLYKYIPKATPIKSSKTKNKDTSKLASIEKLFPTYFC